MDLTTGSRLGPYEIVSRIGAGGMGKVFRARDTRLDRNVAIKILAPEFAANQQFRMRLKREAKTISQLNHPHICTLHDIGHGPLSLAEVLKFGTQIAEAIDRAHRTGVVHRDPKPGNIIVTKSGTKLLDFGLAKSFLPSGAVGGPPAETALATQHKPLTEEGTLIGTFQYMAPEQIDGHEADVRTDIFAVGAVLYESAVLG